MISKKNYSDGNHCHMDHRTQYLAHNGHDGNVDDDHDNVDDDHDNDDDDDDHDNDDDGDNMVVIIIPFLNREQGLPGGKGP